MSSVTQCVHCLFTNPLWTESRKRERVSCSGILADIFRFVAHFLSSASLCVSCLLLLYVVINLSFLLSLTPRLICSPLLIQSCFFLNNHHPPPLSPTPPPHLPYFSSLTTPLPPSFITTTPYVLLFFISFFSFFPCHSPLLTPRPSTTRSASSCVRPWACCSPS